MATYKKYTDKNGNTIYEEIKETPNTNQNNINEQYWKELDRRNKETRKANTKIKIFWLLIATIGFIITFLSIFKFQNFYVTFAGLILMGLSFFFMRDKYSEY